MGEKEQARQEARTGDTIEDAFALWETDARKRLKPSSVEHAACMCGWDIKASLGSVMVRELTREQVPPS